MLEQDTTEAAANETPHDLPKRPVHRQFFGDAERNFVLPPELIGELERKTGAGIGGLCRRLFAGDFRHADILETLRLALIGGGEDPKTAHALIEAYAAHRPLSEILPVAVAVLEALWFGKAAPDAD